MHTNRIAKTCSLIIVIILCIGIAQAKSPIVIDKGIVGSTYTITFEEPIAYLSRDGSEAVPLVSPTTIEKPGIYFLWLTDAKGYSKGTKFTVTAETDVNSWTIQEEKELEEIFKYAMENFKTNITVKLNYGKFNIHQLNSIFFRYANQVEDKYPKLSFQELEITSTERAKPLVKVKITYPLAVTSTLKEYDKWVDKAMLGIINENIRVDMEDYKRELKLYNYIVENTRYSERNVGGRRETIDTPITHTLYGAIKNGVALCDGYAKSLMYLLNAVGIPTQIVNGESYGILHEWNMVKIKDSYYHVDPTRGDRGNEQIGKLYNYLNETDGYMARTHTWDRTKYPVCDNTTYSLEYMPVIMDGVYKVREPNEWKKILEKFINTKPTEASIIFYDRDKYRWEIKKLVSQLTNCLGTEIKYETIEKYNSIILSYKMN